MANNGPQMTQPADTYADGRGNPAPRIATRRARMSAAIRSAIAAIAVSARVIGYGAIGWILVAPLALVTHRRRDRIAVIGRQGGKFLDNCKYFYLQADDALENAEIAFISTRSEVVQELRKRGFHVLGYPSFAAIRYLLTCGIVVVDSTDWIAGFRYFLLLRAKTIQLWHGVPLKRIELDFWMHNVGSLKWASSRFVLTCRLLIYRLGGRWTKYALVTPPSAHFGRLAFAPAFSAREFIAFGYPRNDFARSLPDAAQELAWWNVDTTIATSLAVWAADGRQIVVLAPTFRDSGASPMRLEQVNLDLLDAFGECNRLEFVLKLHPSDRTVDRTECGHVHVCARDSDIYPLLPYAAALVTDYSSIAFDFLYLDRPILHLILGDDDYVTTERALVDSASTLLMGPVAGSWPALLELVERELREDSFRMGRARLRQLAFDDKVPADAARAAIAWFRSQGWLVPADPQRNSKTEDGAK